MITTAEQAAPRQLPWPLVGLVLAAVIAGSIGLAAWQPWQATAAAPATTTHRMLVTFPEGTDPAAMGEALKAQGFTQANVVDKPFMVLVVTRDSQELATERANHLLSRARAASQTVMGQDIGVMLLGTEQTGP